LTSLAYAWARLTPETKCDGLMDTFTRFIDEEPNFLAMTTPSPLHLLMCANKYAKKGVDQISKETQKVYYDYSMEFQQENAKGQELSIQSMIHKIITDYKEYHSFFRELDMDDNLQPEVVIQMGKTKPAAKQNEDDLRKEYTRKLMRYLVVKFGKFSQKDIEYYWSTGTRVQNCNNDYKIAWLVKKVSISNMDGVRIVIEMVVRFLLLGIVLKEKDDSDKTFGLKFINSLSDFIENNGKTWSSEGDSIRLHPCITHPIAHHKVVEDKKFEGKEKRDTIDGIVEEQDTMYMIQRQDINANAALMVRNTNKFQKNELVIFIDNKNTFSNRLTNACYCMLQGFFPSQLIINYKLDNPRPTAAMGVLFHSALILAEAYSRRYCCNVDASNIKRGNLQSLFFYNSFQLVMNLSLQYGAHLPIPMKLKEFAPNLFRLFVFQFNLARVEPDTLPQQIYTNVPIIVAVLVLWWSNLIVAEFDQQDKSFEYTASIPIDLYKKRLTSKGYMAPYGPKRKLNEGEEETSLKHFQLMVKVEVSTNQDENAETMFCPSTLFDKQDYCNSEEWFTEECRNNVAVIKVVPLERFLQKILFSGKNVYPRFFHHLEEFLMVSQGGWSVIKHLFIPNEKDSNRYKPCIFPDLTSAVSKFMEVHVDKKNEHLEGIKKLIVIFPENEISPSQKIAEDQKNTATIQNDGTKSAPAADAAAGTDALQKNTLQGNDASTEKSGAKKLDEPTDQEATGNASSTAKESEKEPGTGGKKKYARKKGEPRQPGEPKQKRKKGEPKDDNQTSANPRRSKKNSSEDNDKEQQSNETGKNANDNDPTAATDKTASPENEKQTTDNKKDTAETLSSPKSNNDNHDSAHHKSTTDKREIIDLTREDLRDDFIEDYQRIPQPTRLNTWAGYFDENAFPLNDVRVCPFQLQQWNKEKIGLNQELLIHFMTNSIHTIKLLSKRIALLLLSMYPSLRKNNQTISQYERECSAALLQFQSGRKYLLDQLSDTCDDTEYNRNKLLQVLDMTDKFLFTLWPYDIPQLPGTQDQNSENPLQYSSYEEEDDDTPLTDLGYTHSTQPMTQETITREGNQKIPEGESKEDDTMQDSRVDDRGMATQTNKTQANNTTTKSNEKTNNSSNSSGTTSSGTTSSGTTSSGTTSSSTTSSSTTSSGTTSSGTTSSSTTSTNKNNPENTVATVSSPEINQNSQTQISSSVTAEGNDNNQKEDAGKDVPLKQTADKAELTTFEDETTQKNKNIENEETAIMQNESKRTADEAELTTFDDETTKKQKNIIIENEETTVMQNESTEEQKTK